MHWLVPTDWNIICRGIDGPMETKFEGVRYPTWTSQDHAGTPSSMDWNGRSLDMALLESHPVNPVPSDFEDSPTDTSILDVLHKVNAGLRAGKMTVPGNYTWLRMICTFLGPRVQRYRSRDENGKVEVEVHVRLGRETKKVEGRHSGKFIAWGLGTQTQVYGRKIHDGHGFQAAVCFLLLAVQPHMSSLTTGDNFIILQSSEFSTIACQHIGWLDTQTDKSVSRIGWNEPPMNV